MAGLVSDDEEGNETFTCERCEQTVSEDDLFSVHTYRRPLFRLITQEWCGECRENHAFVCADCDENFTRDLCFSRNSEYNRICESCSTDYFSCEACGDVHHNDDYSGDGMCRDCDTHNGLQDDGAKPNLKPLGNGKHFYGVELEVEVRDEYSIEDEANNVSSQLGAYAICKGDGSLDAGFEICTSPASLDFHRDKLWTKFFAARHAGLSIRANCGLHVHCSRNPLSELTIAKIVCFVNMARNADFITTIAGREENSYCHKKIKKMADASKRSGDRYEAVNLQPSHTIEFRIFKSTTRQSSLFKALEFCDALIKFCMPAGRSVRDCLSRAKFCAYVAEHKRTWPHLHAFIDATWFGRDNKLAEKLGFLKREKP